MVNWISIRTLGSTKLQEAILEAAGEAEAPRDGRWSEASDNPASPCEARIASEAWVGPTNNKTPIGGLIVGKIAIFHHKAIVFSAHKIHKNLCRRPSLKPIFHRLIWRFTPLFPAIPGKKLHPAPHRAKTNP